MNKNNAITLTLYSIYWSHKEANPQASNSKNNRERPEPRDHFSSERIKRTRARELEPIHDATRR
jgi:hypothetical protein